MRRTFALLAVLLLTLPLEAYQVKRRPLAGATCADEAFSDDYSTDPFASAWTKSTGGVDCGTTPAQCVSWDDPNDQVDAPTTSNSNAIFYYNTPTCTADQYTRALTAANGAFVFRFDAANGDGFYIRNRGITSGGYLETHCLDDFARQAAFGGTRCAGLSFTSSDYMCIELSGADNNATVTVWKNCDDPRPWTNTSDCTISGLDLTAQTGCSSGGKTIGMGSGSNTGSFDDWTGGDL